SVHVRSGSRSFLDSRRQRLQPSRPADLLHLRPPMKNVPSSVTLPEPIPSLSHIHRVPEGGRERAGLVSMDRNERLSPLPDRVVVDEAYFPFSRTTVLPWIDEHPHLVVTRTFSKAWGLAGLRVGMVAAHSDVAANLYKVRSTYDVTAVGAMCVRTLLSHPEVT